MLSLYFFSLLAGMLTILAPCVLPVLPVILGSGLSVSTLKRSFVICVSFVLSVVIFTLLLKVSTLFITADPSIWYVFSGLLLIGFGYTFLFPQQRDWVSMKLGFANSQRLLNNAQNNKYRWSDILLGGALGPVFSSCSPTYAVILAIVFPLSFRQGLICMVLYALGIGIMLFLIIRLGRTFINKIKFLSDPQGFFKKLLGLVILVVGILIITGYDKKLQTFFTEKGIYYSPQREQKRRDNFFHQKNN